jgi:hypothetical protein
MRKFIKLVLIFSSCIISCHGMREFNEAAERFDRNAIAARVEAQQLDAKMDTILNVITFGGYNWWRGDSQPVGSNDNNQAESDDTAHQYHIQPPTHTSRNSRRDSQAYSSDPTASSKMFLWQARKKNNSLNTIIHTLTGQNARILYGLISSGLIFCVGIKSLNKSHDNRLFGYSSTLIGAAGATSMLYDLLLKY